MHKKYMSVSVIVAGLLICSVYLYGAYQTGMCYVRWKTCIYDKFF